MTENIYILVVDDNHENLKVVGNFLKEKDYKIAMATDGKSALKILETTSIDLILLDIMMPEMDGFEVCRKLKENPSTKEIPVIFLTARTETEDIVRGFKMGGVDYITKPFNKEELFARVHNHIQLKLAKDYLVQREMDAIKTRDQYMRTLYGLSKILAGSR
jgi:DNA-binding response OmpR family regulator